MFQRQQTRKSADPRSTSLKGARAVVRRPQGPDAVRKGFPMGCLGKPWVPFKGSPKGDILRPYEGCIQLYWEYLGLGDFGISYRPLVLALCKGL